MSELAPVHAAQGLHERIIGLKAELARNALAFGQALAGMQESRGYTTLGFATFEDYLASEAVGIGRSTAYRFIGVARTFGHVPHAGHLDIDKLDILRRLVEPGDDPTHATALVEQAREMPREQLRAAVRVEVERRKEVAPADYVPTLAPGEALNVDVATAHRDIRRATVADATVASVPLSRPQLMPSAPASLPALADVETSEGTFRESVLREQYNGAIGRLLTAARYADDLYRHNAPEEVARLLTEDEEAPDDQTIVAFTRWVQRVIEARRGIVTIRRA